MRTAVVNRETHETSIQLSLNLDMQEQSKFNIGVGFFEHMLNLLAFRAGITLDVTCKGDLHIDDHHSVEDIGIAFGKALNEALGDKRGIARYGWAAIPMDESLAQCALDICGRGFLVFNAEMPMPVIGNYSTEMTEEFFRAFATHAGISLHVNLVYGKNTHHITEAIFKSVGVALSQAIKIGDGVTGVPSTKGLL